MRSRSIHLWAISQEILEISVLDTSLTITNSLLHLHLRGANGLNSDLCFHFLPPDLMVLLTEPIIYRCYCWCAFLPLLDYCCILSPDGIGENLCDRVLSVLFQLWLLACERCFPSPPLWKTFRDMCANWRHHDALISQWHRVNVALTSRLLKTMFGPDYPELYVCKYIRLLSNFVFSGWYAKFINLFLWQFSCDFDEKRYVSSWHYLIFWGWDKMNVILQTIFTDSISCVKIVVFW